MKNVCVWACLLLLTLAGCSGEKEKRVVPSKGLPYELLLVVDEAVWNDPALQDSLKGVVEAPMPGLPQIEPTFRLLRVMADQYERQYTTMRNQFFVRLNPKAAGAAIGVSRNKEARPQIFVTLEARDAVELASALSTHKQEIIDLFVESEIEQEEARLRKSYSKKVADELRTLAGRTICVPEDIQASKKGERFLWAGTDRIEKDYNVVYYSYPLPAGIAPFTTEHFVAARDSVMKHNIPGSTPEKWMTTTKEKEVPLVETRMRTLDGETLMEVRGLWEMHKGGIGGPFISHVRVDTAGHEVVVCEGFLYSPRTKKRELVRTMEAALRTLTKEKK